MTTAGMTPRPTSRPVSGVNRPFYLTLRSILRWLLKAPFILFKGFRVEGAANLPGTGQSRREQPLILACNHAAFIDSVYLILAVRRRFTICGAKPRLFRSTILRFAMALANIIRVESHEQFSSDTSALLASGENLLIYPEMGRFPEALGDFKTWAAEVAISNRAQLLPCYLYGTTHGHSGPPRLFVGEPLDPEGDATALTQRLRQAIVALAPAPITGAVEMA